MAKRRSQYQLTQDNCEESDSEPDDVGKFQKADDTELKNRIIKSAKRRLQRDEIDGTKATPVFSGFSFDKSASASAKPLFSFGNSGTSTPFAFSSNTSSQTTIFNSKSTIPFQANDKNEKSQSFKSKLKELNLAVLNSIKGYIEGPDLCILTPIFKDYEKYVKDLEEREQKGSDDKAKSPASSSEFKATGTGTGTLSGFSFKLNEKAAKTESTNSAALIATAPTASNTFSFKATPVAAAPPAFGSSVTGFSFGNAVQQAAKAADSSTENKSTENGNKVNDEDEDDEPPKAEFVPVVEEESIYSKRCKIFVKDDGAYKERGTGTLYMKQVKDDKVQLIVRADTNLGNILLNILISKAIPAQRNKNNVVLICIPTPESDPKPRQVLVRVKSEDDAIELLQEYQKHQK